jgi:hypothetical protein
MVVHSALPEPLTAAVGVVLSSAGLGHVSHGLTDPVTAAVAAVEDADSLALLGPYRSAAVSEALEATAPAGLPLLAPVATWAGVTRDDEPGCDDAAQHRGTVFRLVARDTEVAARLAADVRAGGRRAVVVAGEHDYGRQLDGQLELAGLPRTEDGDADLLVLCGLAGEPEIARARELAPLPIVGFDGVQGADLGADRDVQLALPFPPGNELSPKDQFLGVGRARPAAELVVEAVASGAADRGSLLAALRGLGSFDEAGDPIDPPVWLWRAKPDWSLTPERELPPAS